MAQEEFGKTLASSLAGFGQTALPQIEEERKFRLAQAQNLPVRMKMYHDILKEQGLSKYIPEEPTKQSFDQFKASYLKERGLTSPEDISDISTQITRLSNAVTTGKNRVIAGVISDITRNQKVRESLGIDQSTLFLLDNLYRKGSVQFGGKTYTDLNALVSGVQDADIKNQLQKFVKYAYKPEDARREIVEVQRGAVAERPSDEELQEAYKESVRNFQDRYDDWQEKVLLQTPDLKTLLLLRQANEKSKRLFARVGTDPDDFFKNMITILKENRTDLEKTYKSDLREESRYSREVEKILNPVINGYLNGIGNFTRGAIADRTALADTRYQSKIAAIHELMSNSGINMMKGLGRLEAAKMDERARAKLLQDGITSSSAGIKVILMMSPNQLNRLAGVLEGKDRKKAYDNGRQIIRNLVANFFRSLDTMGGKRLTSGHINELMTQFDSLLSKNLITLGDLYEEYGTTIDGKEYIPSDTNDAKRLALKRLLGI